METSKQNGLYRQGSFSNQIIWGEKQFYFYNNRKNNLMFSGLFIFKMVKADVDKFFKQVKSIQEKKSLPVNMLIDDRPEESRPITATDLNHAYWRIAYNLGYISKKTYEKGLTLKRKELRLAALANLGAVKEYKVIKNGKITESIKTITTEKKYKTIYNNIRNTCFQHMQEAAKMLGSDFIAYKTDCIYYYDKPQNRKTIHNYLKNHDFIYKQLVESN